MDSLALTGGALVEPWRLWTGHLAHYGWGHALANATALAVPLVLAERPERPRILLALCLLAPLLSLLLLPWLGAGQYRGASGLVCAAWALAGLRLAASGPGARRGRLLLVGLGLKLGLELALGRGVLLQPDGWRTLPQAHLLGALLGLAAGLAWCWPARHEKGPRTWGP